MKIEFSKNLGEVYYVHSGTEKKVTVFITEDINADAIESVVAQYNAEYSMTRMKGNMEQDERLTGDEVDYIVESLEQFDETVDQELKELANKLNEEYVDNEVPGEMYIVRTDDENGKEIESEDHAPWEPGPGTLREYYKSPLAEEVSAGNATIAVGVTKVTDTVVYVQPGEIERVLGKIHKEENMEPKEQVEKLKEVVTDILQDDLGKVSVEKKSRQPRQPRTAVNATGTTQKTISPQEYIKKLQERIELIKIVDNVITKPEMEVINAVSGEGRKLLLEMSKELDEVVTKYLELIQTL